MIVHKAVDAFVLVSFCGSVSPMEASSTVDALLQAIRTIHSKVGREEDSDDLRALEKVIQSPEMKKAIEVSCNTML